jgi:hypothetical protein
MIVQISRDPISGVKIDRVEQVGLQILTQLIKRWSIENVLVRDCLLETLIILRTKKTFPNNAF